MRRDERLLVCHSSFAEGASRSEAAGLGVAQVAPDDQTNPGPVQEHHRSAYPRPVLVVDDNLALLATVGDILESEGYAVERAANGHAALAVFDRVRPALILRDMGMPTLNGWQFTAELRARGLDIPVVVMTAALDAQRWAGEVGAAGYLAKPFDLMELLTVVQRFLGAPAS